jgi:hypothetical protein
MRPPSLPPSDARQTREQQPHGAGWKAFILNAYVLAFAAEGALHLLGNKLAQNALSIVCPLVMLLVLLMVLMIGSYRNLPWRPIAPALLFSLWEGCLFLPVPAYIEAGNLAILTGSLNLAIGAAVLLMVRNFTGGRGVLFKDKHFHACEFSLARTLKATFLKLFILFPLFLVYLAGSAQLMVAKLSAGFLQIDRKGLHTESRTYELDGRKIHLIPTVHIGSAGFYEKITSNLPVGETVLLPEGVTDRKGLIKSHLDYGAPADSIGLAAQPYFAPKKAGPVHHPCDIDISEMKPETVAVLNCVARAIQAASEGNTVGALAAIGEMGEPDMNHLVADVLELRNTRVIQGLKQVIGGYEHVAIPWGAAHMPGIEREILRLNARLLESHSNTVFLWSDLKLRSQR